MFKYQLCGVSKNEIWTKKIVRRPLAAAWTSFTLCFVINLTLAPAPKALWSPRYTAGNNFHNLIVYKIYSTCNIYERFVAHGCINTPQNWFYDFVFSDINNIVGLLSGEQGIDYREAPVASCEGMTSVIDLYYTSQLLYIGVHFPNSRTYLLECFSFCIFDVFFSTYCLSI